MLEPNHSLDVFHYKSILKIFAKFAGKHLYQDIFLRTLQGSSIQIYYNKDSIRDVFMRKQNLECLWVTASVKHITRNFRKCFSIPIYLSKQLKFFQKYIYAAYCPTVVFNKNISIASLRNNLLFPLQKT